MTSNPTLQDQALNHPGCPLKVASGRSAEETERLEKLHSRFKPFWLTETLLIGPWLPTDEDKAALIRYLNDPKVHTYLLGPPFPYTLDHADYWITHRIERMTKKGTPLDYCIRDMARGGKAIGNVMVSDESDDVLYGDDIGYWLDPEYHGQGLMAKALGLLLQEVSIKEVGKRKFNACAFEGNWSSRRTMEKLGFKIQPDIKRKAEKFGEEVHLWTFQLILTEEEVAQRETFVEATPLPSLAQQR
ncbi:acyl-CoA N-acyltransferase [Gamsiella multidivaricata]|uniref:acyl-CoA N-acyltransferase n=1 Tax=Gamsiella multidivaricata TaxID=101098 RepID=UPI00221EF9CE|nr:acyl-CoA N-acyltransferase [Gamsiella multidivaricata]KAG0355599.1 hypothetical protein BGZ54_001096 [Gamsiella multidivaricata]KAI7821194.1 acyl-CoA N-acyltransferase [Gamsiella multidivaricata]